MKTINESNTAFPSVEVYEQADVFPGVPQAIERPSRALTARTAYLKQKVDELIAGGGGGGTSLPAGQEGNLLFYRSGSWGPGTLGSGDPSIVGLDINGNPVAVESVAPGSIFKHDPDSGVIAGAPASDRWRRTTSFETTAASTSSIVLYAFHNTDESLHRSIQPGQPIKVIDAAAPLHINNGGVTFSLVGVNNLPARLDNRHRLYPSIVSEGGSNYRIDLYWDQQRTLTAGKTGTITGAGTHALASGWPLTGAITVSGTLAANTTCILDFQKLFYVESVSGTTSKTLNLCGPALSTTTGAIKAVYIGDPELVVLLDLSIKGSYAGSATAQALCDRRGDVPIWMLGPARFAQLKACHITVDTTAQPKLSMVINGALTVADGSALAMSGTTKTWTNTVVELTPANLLIEKGQSYELKVQKPGDGRALDSTIYGVFILE